MTDDPLVRDTLVLRHLRGYPDELRHYSNLVKQAHPRGISAIDLLLRRPAAGDSFVAAVARLVAAGEEVLSPVEVAERLGLHPRTFLETVAAHPAFPAPLFANGDRRLWRAAEVERFLQAHPEAVASPPEGRVASPPEGREGPGPGG